VLLMNMLKNMHSNAPTGTSRKLKDSFASEEHTLLDMGEDEFTVGRPHPMIDYSLRNKRIVSEAENPVTAVLLLDIVLGYGSHPDPLAEIVPAIRRATANCGGQPASFAGYLFRNRHRQRPPTPFGGGQRTRGMWRFCHGIQCRGMSAGRTHRSGHSIMKMLFDQELQVINIGLKSFQDTLSERGLKSISLDWKPRFPYLCKLWMPSQRHANGLARPIKRPWNES